MKKNQATTNNFYYEGNEYYAIYHIEDGRMSIDEIVKVMNETCGRPISFKEI